MKPNAERFFYVSRDPLLGQASLSPMLPLLLSGEQSVSVSALVDSGAALNVLPYQIGEKLGFEWSKQNRVVALSGNLALTEARVVVVRANVGQFDPVRLAFAWAKTDQIPIILGQINFFLEFDVCFFRSQKVFEICPSVASSV